VTEPRKIARYGWIPDLPDERDHLYAAPPDILDRPTSLHRHAGTVSGGCTTRESGQLHAERDRRRHRVRQAQAESCRLRCPRDSSSTTTERVIEGTVNVDSGAMIRDGIKSVAGQGVAPEPEWPYDNIEVHGEPSPKAYQDAQSGSRRVLPEPHPGPDSDEGLPRLRLSRSSLVSPFTRASSHPPSRRPPRADAGSQ